MGYVALSIADVTQITSITLARYVFRMKCAILMHIF